MPLDLPVPTSSLAQRAHRPDYQELKTRVHQELLAALDLNRLGSARREDAEPEIRALLAGLLAREGQAMPLSLFERECLAADVLNELFGLGPLEDLLRDPEISDILVNRFDHVYVERNGHLEPTSISFRDD